jgi:hypothetical protein
VSRKSFENLGKVKAETDKQKKESETKIREQEKTVKDMEKANSELKNLKGGISKQENRDLANKAQQALEKGVQAEQKKYGDTEKHLGDEKSHAADLKKGATQKDSDTKILTNLSHALKEDYMKPEINDAKSKSESEARELKGQENDVNKDIDNTTRQSKENMEAAKRLAKFSSNLGG